MKINNIFYYIIAILLLTTACSAPKNLAYFQDRPVKDYAAIATFPEIKYQPNDILTINVSGPDPKTVIPFNLPVVAYDNDIVSAMGQRKQQTYLIDKHGNIDFPVIGTIKLGGLTREEATTTLKNTLKEYINDPIVNIRLANFNVTVLGEVNRPGVYTINNEKVSVAEALGLAGDLTIFGKRENVILVREIDGKKHFAKLDLTSLNVLNGDNYYLTQNDILYVEPNKSKARSSRYNQNYGLLLSLASTLVAIVAIIVR